LWQHHKIGSEKNTDLDIVESIDSLSQIGALDSLHTINKECVKKKLCLNKENVAYNNVHPFSMWKEVDFKFEEVH
jgi:hypothetical protein